MFAATDFARISQNQLEKSIRLSNIAIAGVERLANLQLNYARELLKDNSQTARALSEVRDIQGLVALQQQLAQPLVDKALAVAKDVYDVASDTQSEITQLIEEEVGEFNRNLATTLDKAARSAPAGSEIMVSTLKNAVATATSAYGTVVKTAKKVSNDIAEAGVAAAETSVKAAERASRKTTNNPAAA
ncbi:phasin family protein [Chitinimonas lacunae]|uniref:Phasin family protein n=1 Tax=Chitinimonas lacunae TaxID=1963018 RepID=A0ABV8MM86_9NEIS